VKTPRPNPLWGMHSSTPQDTIDGFTLELLRAGVALTELAGDLIETLPAEDDRAEGSAETVLQMISGTIRSYLIEADEHEVQRATDLMAGALERVIDHLRLALALRRRMDADERLYDDRDQGSDFRN
jgi:hypothetical protein